LAKFHGQYPFDAVATFSIGCKLMPVKCACSFDGAQQHQGADQ